MGVKMLIYVPFLGWISSDLVTPYIIVALPGLGWGVKVCYCKYADSRDMKKIYVWLVANTGPTANFYDISSVDIGGSLQLSAERVRTLCTIHPKINASH